MASTPRSRKAKGRRLQNDVRDLILEIFPHLEPDDVRSTPMGVSGTDIQLSPAAKKVFPYSVEAKNQEKISIWACLDQAIKNAKEGTRGILFFKKNRTKPFVAMELETFIELLTKDGK